MSLTQDDLPPAVEGGESVFDALKKILNTGFTQIGFVGYGPGYTVQNWSFESASKTIMPETSPIISEPVKIEPVSPPQVSPILSEPTTTRIQTVTTSTYAWDDSNTTNATIEIPLELQKNFRITFKANPQNDLHVGFYSNTYQRNINEEECVATSEIENKEVLKLSALVECVFGGWGNTKSVNRFEYVNNRSVVMHESAGSVVIPAANVGVFKTYVITGRLTASTLALSIGYLTDENDEKTFIEMAKITQDNLPSHDPQRDKESIFMALQKPTCTGFNKIGFLGYGTTYEIRDWQVSALETPSQSTSAPIETAPLPQTNPVTPEPVNNSDTTQTVAASAYAWDESNKNATITIPPALQKDFEITFKANPQHDFHIGFYSDTYQRIINSEECVAAAEITTPEDMNAIKLSAVIECVFGGWANTKSVIRFEQAEKRSRMANQSDLAVVIPTENVGTFKAYVITGQFTASTLTVSIGYLANESDKKTFIEMAHITQDNLPSRNPRREQESMWMALQKSTHTGFSKIGFLAWGTPYEIKDWQVSKLETAAATQAEADRLAAETEAARIAAEKTAQEKAATETAAKAEAERIAAETEAARIAAEKAAQEKAAQEAAARAEATRIAAEKAAAEAKAAAELLVTQKTTIAPTTSSTSQTRSTSDTNGQAALTQAYESLKTKLQGVAAQALKVQNAALASTSSAAKLSNTAAHKKLQKNAARLKASADDYVKKMNKAQTTLATTPPPFTTRASITRGRRNVDSLEKYSITAGELIEKRGEEIASVQKQIDTALTAQKGAVKA
jgi:hypothetical protein